jgi:hypothetical protein
MVPQVPEDPMGSRGLVLSEFRVLNAGTAFANETLELLELWNIWNQ